MPSLPTTLFKQPEVPELFRFEVKNKKAIRFKKPQKKVLELVRPRLKIAIVTETWPPEINGVALSLMQLSKGLQAEGHKILLVRPEQKDPCLDFRPNRECLVAAQAIPKYPSLQFGWPQYLKVSKAISEFVPDVVHIVTEGPLGLTALQAAKAHNIPVTSGFHSPFQDFSRFFNMAFMVKPVQHYLRWFHNSTQLTCVPSVDTEQALRQFGVTCPLKVVGRGVDTERFSPEWRSESLRKKWGATPATTVMLYVGRISPEKEIDVLINAYCDAKQNPEKDIKLVIVGDGPDKSRLQKMDGDVIFTGALSGKDLAVAYASGDVFVFASQVETFGNVVLEAMASGLPVVAYNYAAAHEHLEHGVSGWLAPLGQADTLMHLMNQLPNNPRLQYMGKIARQRVQTMGWKCAAQEFEQALYQVVQESLMFR